MAAPRFSNPLLRVWKSNETLFFEFDIVISSILLIKCKCGLNEMNNQNRLANLSPAKAWFSLGHQIASENTCNITIRRTKSASACTCIIVFTHENGGDLKGQYHAIFSNTLKIERRYSVDSSQDIMTKIPLKYYQNAKKLSTDVFAGR